MSDSMSRTITKEQIMVKLEALELRLKNVENIISGMKQTVDWYTPIITPEMYDSSEEKNCSNCKWTQPENLDPDRPELCKSPNNELYILEGYQCWEPIILVSKE